MIAVVDESGNAPLIDQTNRLTVKVFLAISNLLSELLLILWPFENGKSLRLTEYMLGDVASHIGERDQITLNLDQGRNPRPFSFEALLQRLFMYALVHFCHD
jgi:hypothetical protein